MFNTLFDAMPHVTWLYSEDHACVIYVNLAFERVFGRPRTALEDDPRAWLDAVHEDDREKVRAALMSRTSHEAPRPLAEFRILRPSGEVRWLRSSIRRLEGELQPGRSGLFWIETALDVTSEREQALRARRDRELVDRVVELLGAVVVVADPQFRITWWNEAFGDIFGPDVERLRGCDLATVICPGLVDATPEQRLASGGAGCKAVGLRSHVTPAGDAREVEWCAAPLRGVAGDVTEIVGVGRDVTAERNERHARRMADERIGELVRNLPDVPWLYDVEQGEFLLVGPNDDQIWGRPRPGGPDAVQRMFEWLHPEDRGAVMAAFSQLVRGVTSEVVALESRVVRPEGEVRWVATRGAPVRDEHGRVVEIAGYTVDVTESRATARALHERTVELERLLREKDVLLAEVHHRVKNNLQRISGLMHMMAARAHGRPIRETVEELDRRIQAMALVHETLYRSRDLGAVDVQAYLDRIAQAQLDAAEAGRRSIEIGVRAPGLTMDLDASFLCGLVVSELTSNSLKHAFGRRRRGRIDIAMERVAGERLVLRVSDDGRRLPDEIDFGSEATLGLRLVSGLAEQLGGVARRVPGPTSAIEIEFPAPG